MNTDPAIVLSVQVAVTDWNQSVEGAGVPFVKGANVRN